MELEKLERHLFEKFPIRFTRKEKDSFLLFIKDIFLKIGYSEKEINIKKMEYTVENNNLCVGKNAPEYLFTAHYDTPGKTGFYVLGSKIWGTGIATFINAFLLLLVFSTVFLINSAIPGFYSLPFFTKYLISMLILLVFLLIFVVIPMLLKNNNNRNDNTSGVVGLLRIAELCFSDEKMKDKCGFVLFDNEEWGLLGSSAYKKQMRKNGVDLSKTKIINLDCIGIGEILTLISSKDTSVKKLLFKKFNEKNVDVISKKSSVVFMSDHMNFKNSVNVCRMSKSKTGHLYIPNLHTKNDTVSDVDEINSLAENIFAALSGDEE